jgi:indolepyruvate ferredoxin oxidoreductase
MGINQGPISLDQKYTQGTGPVFLTGIQALVRLPIEQHRADLKHGLHTATFISGYEGSPLGGYDLALLREGKLLKEHDIRLQPGLNEEIAATSIAGSQHIPKRREGLDGVVGIWYGKAPGFDRAHDALRHGNLIGASEHGGVLVLTGDDPGCKSSTIASASEGGLADLGMPVLYPGNAQEIIDLGLLGVALSRYTGAWVGFKIVTDVADTVATVGLDGDRPDPIFPVLEIDGQVWKNVQIPQFLGPAHTVWEQRLYRGRHLAALEFAAANGLNRITVNPAQARIGIVAAGKTWYDLRQALADLGLDDEMLLAHGIRLLKLGMIAPLEPGIVKEFAEGLEEIVVIEEKRPFIERAIRDVLYNLPQRPRVVGNEDEEGRPLFPVDGELNPDRIAPLLAGRLRRIVDLPGLAARVDAVRQVAGREALPVMTARTPYFCSGCPHNRSTVVPDGSLVGAGIGCHTLVQISGDPRREGTGYTQMGGEGAQWIGQAPYSEAGHLFQNVGDGTFFHSGSLAVRAAIASGVNVTYKLLYNSAVAMTGGQQATGAQAVPDVVRLLQAEGIKKIIVLADDVHKYPKGTRWPSGVDLWPRERLEEAQLLLRETPGATALIYDQQCATEARRRRKRGLQPEPTKRVYINEMVCEGCGDCGRVSNCLSVQPIDTEFGRKTHIHQSSCNRDYSCLEGDCPSFVTVETLPAAKDEPKPRPDLPAPPVDLPLPALPAIGSGFNIYLMGIGGTGIVTTNQVLATAATLEGRAVNGLDQTGLSQKAGPVVSHLRIMEGEQDSSGRISAATADAWLAFDALVAVTPQNLAAASPERTIAVVSTGETPTGSMIRNNRLTLPGVPTVHSKIDSVSRADRNVYLDSLKIAEGLLHDHMMANTVLIGAAWQAGALPLSLEAIEAAIRLNGVAVGRNLAAFGWGRAAVAAPAALEAALQQRAAEAAPASTAPVSGDDPRIARAIDRLGLPAETARIARIRAAELVAYQNPDLAKRYVALVRDAARAEAAALPGDGRFSAAVARYYYKLLAYKDEYEVARLYLDPRFTSGVAGNIPEGGTLRYHLHPPLLRALGVKHKIALGPWFRNAYRLLYAMRRVRGTKLDIFGYANVRRVERELIGEYEGMIRDEIARLSPASYGRAVAVAELPDLIRGYEEIKLANVEKYHAELAKLSEGPAAIAAG